MLVPTLELLRAAQRGRYAIGAFNVYNLEGVRAVVAGAEASRSPFLLQVHPAAYTFGGTSLLALCVAAAHGAAVPGAVQLDHSSSEEMIAGALAVGVSSVMADGSHLPYADNVAFSRAMARLAHRNNAAIEAELGRLSGSEDGQTVAEYEAQLTDPEQAAAFAAATDIDMLAICIGNVHGVYTVPPQLDIERLDGIRRRVALPLVLHGASGLPEAQIACAIAGGVCKFNVNTELRQAYVGAMQTHSAIATNDQLELMHAAVDAMKTVVVAKVHLFGSVNRA